LVTNICSKRLFFFSKNSLKINAIFVSLKYFRAWGLYSHTINIYVIVIVNDLLQKTHFTIDATAVQVEQLLLKLNENLTNKIK